MFDVSEVRWGSGDCMNEITTAVRIENQAVAAQLGAIGRLFRHRLAQSADTEAWAVDIMEAVAAEVAAGLRISQPLALERVGYDPQRHQCGTGGRDQRRRA